MNSDLDDATRLMRRAKADLAALRGMGDAVVFDDNIFGFHAQQAVEKALKAWLAVLGRDYPFRHDLGELLAALGAAGEIIDDLWPLVDLTAFAVQLRYDDMEIANQLNRNKLVDSVAALLNNVERKIDHG
ncbi:MAG: HEPN domain-containing protein [Sulfuricella sp.]|nr:HEPN domain-containing protein [Sulfuricella sp.]